MKALSILVSFFLSLKRRARPIRAAWLRAHWRAGPQWPIGLRPCFLSLRRRARPIRAAWLRAHWRAGPQWPIGLRPCFLSLKRRAAAFLFLFLSSVPAYAQTAPGEIFTRKGHADLAIAWLRALFRGENLGGMQTDAAFGQIAHAISRVLGIYSVGMLVLAGFLLLYYALVFIAQTAHAGKIQWTQKSKIWAPLRFALVMGLLVPVGGGLNLGQYMIVKLAEQGSALASNAWQSAGETMKDSFAGLVAPRAPDVRPVAARAVEMALCRSIYRHYFDAYQPDEALIYAGEINDLQRAPAQRLSEETWRYANRLHDAPPLCGAYRFLAPSSGMLANADSGFGAASGIDPSLPLLGDSARAAAERLVLQADAFAEDVVTAFIQSQSVTAEPVASSVFARFLKDQQNLLDGRIAALVREKTKTEKNVFIASQESGWVSAGWLLVDLMNRQAALGDMASMAVPSIDPPLLGHAPLAHQSVAERVESDPILRTYADANLFKLYAFYDKAQTAMKKARAWLYRDQLESPALVLPAAWDVADALPEGSDSEKGFAVFRRTLDSGFTSFGVWGRAVASEDKPLSNPTLSDDMRRNPMGALAEMGRRYVSLGTWTLGATGRFLFDPSCVMPAASYAVLGGLIVFSGFALLFLVPLLPLLRFVAAVLTWILLVFEAVASVPLVAIAHMNPSGEGLVSETAKRAYGLWLSVFIRPFLIVFGFLVGWAGFFLGVLFLNEGFAALADSISLVQSGSLTGLRVLLTVLYAVFVLAIANVTFKGISFFPERAIEWLGGMVQGAGSAAFRMDEPVATAAKGFASTASHAESVSSPGGSAAHGGPRSAHKTRETVKDPMGRDVSLVARENRLFPQYKDREVPSYAAQAEGGKAFAASVSESGASAAAARSEKEGAVAIATAKASVTIGEKGENALSELAKEAREIILGESEQREKEKQPLSEDEEKREESRPQVLIEIGDEKKE